MRPLVRASFALALLGACSGQAIAPAAGRMSEPEAQHATAPFGSIGAAPHRVVVVSDLNGGYGSTDYGEHVRAAVERIVAMRPDLVISTGDLVAGQRPGLDYRAMWRSFHEEIGEPLADAGIPFAPSPGNHDASAYGAHVEEREVFVDEWRTRLPDVEAIDMSHFPLRYSFVAGGALFVAIDATTIGPLAAEQKEWLRVQLEAERDREVKIVYGHLPIHPFTHGRETQTLRDEELEALLVEEEVDLYASGHHHGYFPGRHGALRVVSVGCLGGGPRPLIGTDSPSPRSFTVIELDERAIGRVEALLAPAFDHAAPRSSLPERIGDVVRDDL